MKSLVKIFLMLFIFSSVLFTSCRKADFRDIIEKVRVNGGDKDEDEKDRGDKDEGDKDEDEKDRGDKGNGRDSTGRRQSSTFGIKKAKGCHTDSPFFFGIS